MKSKKINIGTSGWDYKHWAKVFYPEDLKRDDWFNYYSKKFNSVEINNTFYHMPDEDTPREITSDTIYIRLHGTNKKYSGSYSHQQLTGWKRWIENRLVKVKSAYIFFNNDDKGYAAKNALKLKQMFS